MFDFTYAEMGSQVCPTSEKYFYIVVFFMSNCKFNELSNLVTDL